MPKKKEYHLIQKIIRGTDPQLDRLRLPDYVNEKRVYGINVIQDGKKRRYLIELHIFNGFSFVKFYPHCKKNHPNRFALRESDIGYGLGKGNIIKICIACGEVMKDYLDEYPDDFVGYIGQPDKKDDLKGRKKSQRASIYGSLTSSIFSPPKYSVSSRTVYENLNMRLIRKIRRKHRKLLSIDQEVSFSNFAHHFDSQSDCYRNIMTQIAWDEHVSRTQNL